MNLTRPLILPLAQGTWTLPLDGLWSLGGRNSATLLFEAA